jgi:hypothetical protein
VVNINLRSSEHGEIKLFGAATIMRYLGKIGKMNGSNTAEKALIDMWCEYIDQVCHIVLPPLYLAETINQVQLKIWASTDRIKHYMV